MNSLLIFDALTITDKGRQNMVTEADVEVEVLIRDRLAERFPGDAFLGEETGRSDVAGSEGIWVVDPIDGTQPFISGMTSWCVSMAFVFRGVLEMGFVSSPARDEVFIGRRGGGATLNGRPIAVRPTTRIDDGILYMGYSPRIGADDVVPIFDRVLRQGAVYYRAIARLGEGRTEEARRLLEAVDEKSDFHQAARALLATLPKH